MRTILLTFSIVMAAVVSVEAGISAKQTDDAIEYTIDGQPFATFISKGFKKPFFKDIHAPDGTIITRSLEEEAVTDHPHHKGLWLAIDEIDELKHWAEGHTIRVTDVALVEDALEDGHDLGLSVETEWLNEDEQAVLKETTDIILTDDRLISYDIRLTPAGNEAVEFGDTKEGLFAVRLRDELREKGGSGTLVNSNGQQREGEVWGQEAAWVDYSGTVEEGAPTVGVSLFDHPKNPRPGRYHARAYGLFAVNPFGPSAYTNGKLPKEDFVLKPGETIRLRYAAWFHDGDAEQAQVAARFQEYVEQSGE